MSDRTYHEADLLQIARLAWELGYAAGQQCAQPAPAEARDKAREAAAIKAREAGAERRVTR